MTPMQRILTTLGQQEADRVPLALLFTVTGAKFSQCSIEQYFNDAEQVAAAQIQMQQRYQTDCFYGFYYAAAEVEAFGGETIFFTDGPPNAGDSVIQNLQAIGKLRVPEIEDVPVLQRILTTQRLLKAHAQDTIPIIGVAISPFSLPVMQMGLEAYLNLITHHPVEFQQLMAINQAFTLAWAKAQLAAGATAICYFDPMASATMLPKAVYLRTGYLVAQQTLAQINGATAIHLASGRCLDRLDELISTGSQIIAVSIEEDLAKLKRQAAGRVTLMGNLNGIEMRRWTKAETVQAVKTAIAKAGRGGGFMLADNHGEIPWQVADETLLAIRDAVAEWGQYPLNWIENER